MSQEWKEDELNITFDWMIWKANDDALHHEDYHLKRSWIIMLFVTSSDQLDWQVNLYR